MATCYAEPNGRVRPEAALSSSPAFIPSMLPSIALAHGIEMLRDGGSLCASFQGANGSYYWLLLPVVLEGNKVIAYEQPVIVERPFAAKPIQISWAHAKIILQQVDALLPNTEDRKHAERMYKAIGNAGRVV
jgi:hypothetical protein